MHNFTTAIFINAPADKVWRAITDPLTIRQAINGDITTGWQKGDEMNIEYIWEGKTFTEHGVITESKPSELLTLSYLPIFSDTDDKPENYQHVSLHLDEMEKGTHLRVELENILGEFYFKRIPEIWGEILYKIKEASED